MSIDRSASEAELAVPAAAPSPAAPAEELEQIRINRVPGREDVLFLEVERPVAVSQVLQVPAVHVGG